MEHWISFALDFLSNNSKAIWVAAGMIVAGAGLAFALWFRPAEQSLLRALNAVADALDPQAGGWPASKESAGAAARGHAAVIEAWRETEDRVVALPNVQGMKFVLFSAPRDLWTAPRLLSRSINFSLAEAVPNLLVGIGLLLTFLFLTLALTQATSALVAHTGPQQADLMGATRGLLGAAGAKFMTSLAGLLASICWAILFRRAIARLDAAAEGVLQRLGRVVPTGGGERFMLEHLLTAQETLQSQRQDRELLSQFLAGQGEQLDVANEQLNEAREQTGTFKRFETDLAISLAGAINQAFSPQMEAMTDRLVRAIDGLSDRLGTMNQEALERMLEDFSAMLTRSTQSEMARLRETLEALVDRLNGAGEALGHGAGVAAEGLTRAGTDLVVQMNEARDSLGQGAGAVVDQLGKAGTNLVEQMHSAGVVLGQGANAASLQLSAAGTKLMEDIESAGQTFRSGADAAVERLNDAGKGLSDRIGEVSSRLSENAEHLGSAAERVRSATDDLGSAIAQGAEFGRRGAESARVLIISAESVVSTIQAASAGISEAMATIDRLSDLSRDLIASMSELAQEQRTVVGAVREAIPAALDSLTRVQVTLEETIRATARSMNAAKSAMEATSHELASTVATITGGVAEYSRNVADLHGKMDVNLAKAVSSLDSGIKSLSDAIDDLEEALSPRNIGS